jgi:hypothetical protein
LSETKQRKFRMDQPDLPPGERVWHELDALIEVRARARTKDEEKLSEEEKEMLRIDARARLREAERLREVRQQWIEHHARQAEAHALISAEHQRWARALETEV